MKDLTQSQRRLDTLETLYENNIDLIGFKCLERYLNNLILRKKDLEPNKNVTNVQDIELKSGAQII